MSFPNQAVRAIVESGTKDICFVSLSTSVVRIALDEFAVKSTFVLPGNPGIQGSVSGLLLVSESLWICGSRSMWLVSPYDLSKVRRELALPKTTSKVIDLSAVFFVF